MDEIIKQSTELYYEIDDCITRLIKARLDKDANKENVALFEMESLLINTMQHMSWMVNELEDNSEIKWQTGEPKEGGLYVVTNYKGEIEVDRYEKAATIDYGVFAKSQTGVRAWCKLSDIKPYKEGKL